MTDKLCIRCGSENIVYNHDHGFYRCNNCNNVWAYPGDDPDNDEFDNEDPDLQDALLEQMLGSGQIKFI
jgi:ribosomal protein L37AE/L43A